MLKTNNLLFLLVIIQLLASCYTKKEEYPDCFSEKNIYTFNLLVDNFEKHLVERYNTKDIDLLYKSYLEDLSQNKIDKHFVLSDRTVNVLYSLSDEDFVEIWTLPLEDGTFFDDSDPNIDPNSYEWSIFYTIDPREKFYNCGIKNSSNKEIVAFFEKSIKIGEISYDLLSSAFLEVIKNDKISNNNLTRLIIAIKFYYEISLYYSSIEIRE